MVLPSLGHIVVADSANTRSSPAASGGHEKSYPCNSAALLHGNPLSVRRSFQTHPSIPIPLTNQTQSFRKEKKKTHSSHALAGPIPCTRPNSTAAFFTSSNASSSGIVPCVIRLPMARQETAFCDAVGGVSAVDRERVKGREAKGKRSVPRL